MSEKIKNIAKGGWHPGKKEENNYQYGSTSDRLRKDYKGVDTVMRWSGRGGKASKSDYNPDSHQSAPLSSLKDPSAFGPPPRRHGTADSFGSGPSSPASPSVPPRAYNSGGLGAALSQDHLRSMREREEQEQREAEEEAERQAHAPPVPYKTDTTGLSTAGLPPPPKFKGDGAAQEHSMRPAPAAAGRPVPSLPPRLPARATASPPPSYDEAAAPRPNEGVLNQGALNRLGRAGVNVPGLEIGGSNRAASHVPALPTRPQASTPPVAAASRPEPPASPSTMGHGGQLSELQARFARMGNNSPNAPSSPTTSAPESPIKKKAPPPPPKKKELHSTELGSEPPPVPLGSKPR